MGREVGGGFRMGNTCKSMADSCQCMAKILQYCKVISLQLIKINGKTKNKKKLGPIILSSLCPSPTISHSSRDPWYLLVNNKQDVSPWFATGVSWLLGSFGRHSHISALAYIFEGLCVCQNLKFQSNITGLMLAFHLLVCVYSSTDLEKTGFHY